LNYHDRLYILITRLAEQQNYYNYYCGGCYNFVNRTVPCNLRLEKKLKLLYGYILKNKILTSDHWFQIRHKLYFSVYSFNNNYSSSSGDPTLVAELIQLIS